MRYFVSRCSPVYSCKSHRRHEFDSWARKIPWRRIWQPTAVFLPGESHGPRSLAGYSPWGRKESDTTEATKHSIPYIMCFQPKNLWPSSGLNNSQPWLLQVLLLLQSLFFFHWKGQTHDAIFLNYLPCLLQLSLFISEPILSEFQRTVFQFTDYVFNYSQCHSYLLFLSSWTPHSCVKLGWFLHPSESQLLLNGIVIPHF